MAQQNEDQTILTPNPGSPNGAEETKSSEFALRSNFCAWRTASVNAITLIQSFRDSGTPSGCSKSSGPGAFVGHHRMHYPTAISLNRYN